MTNPSKILFTGITGLLGKYFLKSLKSNFRVVGIADKTIQSNNENLFKVDIADKQSIEDFVRKNKPVVIVHAASIGNVDYCEKHPEEAYRINIQGTKNIISAAKSVDAKIIFLSSNAIFDGINPPYDENGILNPLDVYGKTKVEGERLISESQLSFCILRLITMYGWPQKDGRGNPVTWVIDNLKKSQKINVVNDVYNNHLWAGQAAEIVWRVIKENINGIYNIAGNDCISRYDFALKVARIFKLDSSLISPVSSDFFKDIAMRPKNTCFNTQKMRKELGIKPFSIDEGLRLMKQELLARNR